MQGARPSRAYAGLGLGSRPRPRSHLEIAQVLKCLVSSCYEEFWPQPWGVMHPWSAYTIHIANARNRLMIRAVHNKLGILIACSFHPAGGKNYTPTPAPSMYTQFIDMRLSDTYPHTHVTYANVCRDFQVYSIVYSDTYRQRYAWALHVHMYMSAYLACIHGCLCICNIYINRYTCIYIYICYPSPVIYHFRPLKPNLTAAAVKS